MERIPQSTTKRVALKAYLANDHVTAATGKTIAIVISKNGAAFGNPSAGATNATEIGSGWYYVDISTTDTGTTGPLVVRGTQADIDATEKVMEVESVLAAIKAKTDQLTFTVANQIDANTLTSVNSANIGEIKTKTDNLPTDPADASDVAGSFATVNNTLTTIASYIDTEVGAIKAKTDNLPANPASVSDIPTASQISTQVSSDLSAAHGAGSWATATGFSTLTQSDIRTAVGMAANDLDAQLAALAALIGASASPTVAQIADGIIGRRINGGANGGRTIGEALAALRNKWTISSGIYRVYDIDDTTELWNSVTSSSPSADPLVGSDPA